MRRGKNPTVSKAKIPQAIAGLAAVDAVASTGPELNLVIAFNWAGLGASAWRAKNQEKNEKRED
jgi:hypothetical protein